MVLLRDEGESYVQTISSLRSLVTEVAPYASKLDGRPRWVQLLHDERQLLPEAKRDVLSATLFAASGFIHLLAMGKLSKPVGDTTDREHEHWEEVDLGEFNASSGMGDIGNSNADADFKLLKTDYSYRIVIDDDDVRLSFFKVLDAYERDLLVPQHGELLRRSILTMAVGAFEVLIGVVRRAHLLGFSGSLGSKERTFTLSEILEFGSVDDAIDEAIAREVDEFTRRGFKDWEKWFATGPLKLPFDSIYKNLDDLAEVLERRNAVIHNGGRATDQYVRNVKGRGSVGDLLPVDEAYLDSAIEALYAFGVNLLYSVRSKSFPEEREAACDWILEKQFDALVEGRNTVVCSISEASRVDVLSAQYRELLKVNGWIAAKRLGVEGISSEVRKWDTSALHPRFEMARLLLIDDVDAGLEVLRRLVAAEEITVRELTSWPLLEAVRASGGLAEFGISGSREGTQAQVDGQVDEVDSEVATSQDPSGGQK